jgi:hypothetical protein
VIFENFVRSGVIRKVLESFVKNIPPTSRGGRFANIDAGTEKGFLKGASHVFLCKKNSMDEHDEVDGECYEGWLSTHFL